MKFVLKYLLPQLASTIKDKKIKIKFKKLSKVVKKFTKSCQKVVQKLSKSCQKSCQKVVKKKTKSCQKISSHLVIFFERLWCNSRKSAIVQKKKYKRKLAQTNFQIFTPNLI
jgi:hypothetical protein